MDAILKVFCIYSSKSSLPVQQATSKSQLKQFEPLQTFRSLPVLIPAMCRDQTYFTFKKI